MRGATNLADRGVRWIDYISIHAPHAGRDKKLIRQLRRNSKFQSTRPMRGATMEHGDEIAVE